MENAVDNLIKAMILIEKRKITTEQLGYVRSQIAENQRWSYQGVNVSKGIKKLVQQRRKLEKTLEETNKTIVDFI